jgi:hypothetical protein
LAMNDDVRVTCEICGLESPAQHFLPITSPHGRGLAVRFTCPICGHREQSFVHPGELPPGEWDPRD